MKIDRSIQDLLPIQRLSIDKSNGKQSSFTKMLNDELNKINSLQIKADDSVQQLITGETEDIHGVMIATEEARLALEMGAQIRNKLIDAYQEISRMQL